MVQEGCSEHKNLTYLDIIHLVFIANEKDGWKPCKRNRAHLRPFRSANGKKYWEDRRFKAMPCEETPICSRHWAKNNGPPLSGLFIKNVKWTWFRIANVSLPFHDASENSGLLYTSIDEVGSEYHTLEKSLGPQTGLSRYHAGVYRCIGIQGN